MVCKRARKGTVTMQRPGGQRHPKACLGLSGRTTRVMIVRDGSVADAARMTERISDSLCLHEMRSYGGDTLWAQQQRREA